MILQSDNIVLRDEDAEECRAGGMTPTEALVQSVELSTHSEVLRAHDGTIIAYWGFHDMGVLSSRAFMWCLSTPAADKYPVAYGRESRRVVNWLLETHHELFCMADREYTRSILWLDWLGFRRYTEHGRFIQMINTRGGAA